MSRFSQHRLQCPHCSNLQETPVWDSINVTMDPDLKAKLYAAEINVFDCEACGKKMFIDAPLLYHDASNEFCVQYYPGKAIDEERFLGKFNADGSLDLEIPEEFSRSAAYLAHPHIVFDMNEMIRYIRFRDGIAASINY